MRPAAIRCVSGFLLGILLWPAAALAQAPLDEAKRLIDQGQAGAAYALLAPLEDERAGDPDFDYLLGVSALEAGNASVAVFPLERVLAVQPGHKAARAQLARAYFELHENELAQQEFDAVSRMSPPDKVRDTIASYLGALSERLDSEKPTQWTGHLEIGGGFDSNANSATALDSVVVPLLANLDFALAPTGQEQSSPFIEGEGGIEVTHRFDADLQVFARGRANLRNYTAARAEVFDADTYDGAVGLSWGVGPDAFSMAVEGQLYSVDHDPFRQTSGVSAQYRRVLDARNQVTVFGRAANIDFQPDIQSGRDVTQLVGGVGYGHAFEGKGTPTVFASIYVGTDDEDNDAFTFVGRDFVGGNFGGQYTVRDDLDLYGSLSLEFSDYGGTQPFFLRGRDDTYYELRAGLTYRPYGQWTVRPELRYVRNDSNIPTSDFTRTTAQLSVRYDFD
jgi:hypothetical protein